REWLVPPAMIRPTQLRICCQSRQFTALRKDKVIELKGQRQVKVPVFQKLYAETGDHPDG
ncbi:MAG: hypothetical protein VW292_09355, partial [Alphaproteobacteria bacterium]